VNGPVNGPVNGEDYIVLDRWTAEDLAHVVTVIEDWLLHTGGEVADDLAEFVGACNGRGCGVPAFIDALGNHSVQLHRALRALSGQTA
jgi:hypothetical protein